MQATLPTTIPTEAQPNPAAVDLFGLGVTVLLTIVLVVLIFFVVKIIHDLRSYRYR
jgi:hypothetical protein